MSEKEPMDANKLWGWGKLYNADGTFRTGRTVVNAVLHALIAFGAALVVTTPLAYFATFGFLACAGVGSVAGVLAMLLREGIQWATSGSPHLADRALDIAPAIPGGLLGGITCYFVVSRFLLSAST